MNEIGSLANEITRECEIITRTCASIRRIIKVIYVELALCVMLLVFGLGVQVGKTMCH